MSSLPPPTTTQVSARVKRVISCSSPLFILSSWGPSPLLSPISKQFLWRNCLAFLFCPVHLLSSSLASNPCLSVKMLIKNARSKKTIKIMDPDCAICSQPALVQCECEAKGLDTALRQAEQRMMASVFSDIRYSYPFPPFYAPKLYH